MLSGATEAQAAFIAAARVGRLASVDAQGHPHVLPVCYALVERRIYSPIDEKPKRVPAERLRRVQNIIGNHSVCLVIDRYEEDWDCLAWVQVRGEATLVHPGEPGHTLAIEALRARYPQYGSMRLEQRPLICIQPDTVVSWRV